MLAALTPAPHPLDPLRSSLVADATRKAVNKAEKGTGVYSAPTGTATTRRIERKTLYTTIGGISAGSAVLLGELSRAVRRGRGGA